MTHKVEQVVLVDENDDWIGVHEKQTVHSSHTPLHRAFSLFLFNSRKQLLLQQRAAAKKTWPLVWSNSCCGHPLPEESYEDAVKRRTFFELGISLKHLFRVSDYRYCFTKDGIMENEICPIFAAFYNGRIFPNRDEIESIRWIAWNDWIDETTRNPGNYSPWCIEETRIMAQKKEWKKQIREMVCC